MLNRLPKTLNNFFYRLFPVFFWVPYARRAKRRCIESLYVLLSYDCDTAEDALASEELFAWLKERDIPATFAVPGEQLQEGAKSYRRLKDEGAAFINHGDAAHTEWREGRYWSTSFYNRMPPELVEKDIRRGHQIFKEVLGEEPSGFRAPHFGHFQSPDQLELIYTTLRDLGSYRFSTTTTPHAARRHGPLIELSNLVEFPIVGSYLWPLRIFDSWGYRENRLTRNVRDDYAQDFLHTVKHLKKRRIPAILNYYADPAHVYKNQAYFSALTKIQELGVSFIDYEELLLITRSARNPS